MLFFAAAARKLKIRLIKYKAFGIIGYMFVHVLDVTDFRNYERQRVEFSPGLNVLSGANAQGKTNLLEAVYLASVGRSPRTPRDKELIRWGCQRAVIRVGAAAEAGRESVEIILDKALNKTVSINKLPITRMGELMGVIPTVFFAPGEIKVVQSSPGERRSFMDIALCQMSKAYFYLLQRYNKILSQRNRLLKSGRADADTLDVWDMQIADNGAKIVKSRKGFVKRLFPHAKINHLFLTNSKENIELLYDGADGETAEEIKESLLKELSLSRARDLDMGYTHAGPQKDDIVIKVNDIDVRSYGSQGQLRTAALTLKLAELDLYKEETGASPVLLLDDVLSELDISRQIKLFERTKNFQTILTCTHIDKDVFPHIRESKVFKVEGGKIK